MKKTSGVVGVGAAPITQVSRYDRIHSLSTALEPSDRKLDWVAAVAYALDAYDDGIRKRTREAVAAFDVARWRALSNRGAALKAFALLCDNPEQFIGVPV